MNKLTRTIEPYEIVVLGKQFVEGDLDHRAFVCLNGPGMSELVAGSDITGYWLQGEQPYLISGDWLDPRDTIALQRAIGRFEEKPATFQKSP